MRGIQLLGTTSTKSKRNAAHSQDPLVSRRHGHGAEIHAADLTNHHADHSDADFHPYVHSLAADAAIKTIAWEMVSLRVILRA